MAGIYLGLGANLGDRRANLKQALRLLEPIVHVEAVSALYESTPQPPAPPPDYLNAVCRVVTALSPGALLQHVKGIEAQMGRRDTGHWGPRPIDIDILLYEDTVIDTETLIVPHPRLTERAFVLRPLLDLDSELTLPVGRRVEALLAVVGESDLVEVEGIGWEATG